jgi:hypothetical protein
MEEVASLLGHKVVGRSINERYVSFSYQTQACAAIDKLTREVLSHRGKQAMNKAAYSRRSRAD